MPPPPRSHARKRKPAAAAAAGKGATSTDTAELDVEGFLHDGELLLRDRRTNNVFMAERDEVTNERTLVGTWDPREGGRFVRSEKGVKSDWGTEVVHHLGDKQQQQEQQQQQLHQERAKKKPPVPQGVARPLPPVLHFPDPAEEEDHCETSLLAYKDVMPVLQALAKAMGKDLGSELALYDPYFCTGKVKVLLRELGVHNVYNENEDAYSETSGPQQFDVLLTNPPYSGNHVDRLMRRVARATQPALLLVPSYVAWRHEAFLNAAGAFYIVPSKGSRYTYHKPSGLKSGQVGRTSPFPSLWCCVCRDHARAVQKAVRGQANVFPVRERIPWRYLDSRDPLVSATRSGTATTTSSKREKKRGRFHADEARVRSQSSS